jgi:MFS family permease
MYTLINVFMLLGYAVPLFYIPAFGQLVLHTDVDLSYYLLAVASAASFIGRLVVSGLATKTGVMPLWVACGAFSSLIAFCWIAVDSTKGFIAFSVFYGFASGGLIALPPAVLPLVCPDLSKLGSRMGMSWAPTAISVLIGPPIAGALVKNEDNFLGVQVWAGVVLALGTAQTVFVWLILSRKLKKVWF